MTITFFAHTTTALLCLSTEELLWNVHKKWNDPFTITNLQTISIKFVFWAEILSWRVPDLKQILIYNATSALCCSTLVCYTETPCGLMLMLNSQVFYKDDIYHWGFFFFFFFGGGGVFFINMINDMESLYQSDIEMAPRCPVDSCFIARDSTRMTFITEVFFYILYHVS